MTIESVPHPLNANFMGTSNMSGIYNLLACMSFYKISNKIMKSVGGGEFMKIKISVSHGKVTNNKIYLDLFSRYTTYNKIYEGSSADSYNS